MKPEIPAHLEIPAAYTAKHRFPKRSIRVDVTQEPRLLRRIEPNESNPIARRDESLAIARECDIRAKRARKAARKEYGDAGGIVPCPVSAGLCDHWPEDAKESVRVFVHLRNDWEDIARAWHVYAGKRPATFPVEFATAGGHY